MSSQSAGAVPRSFSGEGDWREWREDFEQLAATEKWDEEKKLILVEVSSGGASSESFTDTAF